MQSTKVTYAVALPYELSVHLKNQSQVDRMKLGSKYYLLETPCILKYKQIVWKYALSTIIYYMQLSAHG